MIQTKPCSWVVPYKKVLTGEALEKFGHSVKDLGPDGLARVVEKGTAFAEWKNIEARIDPLLGMPWSHTTLISQERAAKERGISTAEEKKVTGTDFNKTNHKSKTGRGYKTGLPAILYDEIMSVPNFWPFMYPHYVTLLTSGEPLEHLPKLNDVTLDMMVHFLETGKHLHRMIGERDYNVSCPADVMAEEERIPAVNMWDFINLGPTSGQSQAPLHAQRGATYWFMQSRGRKEQAACATKNGLSWEDYLTFVREHNLAFFEDENIIAFAAYAPRFTDEIDIVTKAGPNGIIRNYADLQKGCIDSIAAALHLSLHALALKMYVSSVNVVTHQADYGSKDDYRMHFHILPRESVFASMEGEETYVVSAYPETTAKLAREHYADTLKKAHEHASRNPTATS